MSQTSDPVLIYVVSWRYFGNEEFSYTVRMKESQARLIEELLEKNTGGGSNLAESSVEEVGDPISARQIMKIIKEEFPNTGKDWMP